MPRRSCSSPPTHLNTARVLPGNADHLFTWLFDIDERRRAYSGAAEHSRIVHQPRGDRTAHFLTSTCSWKQPELLPERRQSLDENTSAADRTTSPVDDSSPRSLAAQLVVRDDSTEVLSVATSRLLRATLTTGAGIINAKTLIAGSTVPADRIPNTFEYHGTGLAFAFALRNNVDFARRRT